MIGIISYGTDYVDNHVSDGVDKLMYCSRCKKSTTFSEYYGQKHSYLFGISLGAIGSKKNYLKCTKCKKIIFTDNNEIERLRGIKNNFKQAQEEFSKLEAEGYFKTKIKCLKCNEQILIDPFETNETEKEAKCLKCGYMFVIKKNI
jgi:DNA-directed RNA polymerase subunit RPC12/RpoP